MAQAEGTRHERGAYATLFAGAELTEKMKQKGPLNVVTGGQGPGPMLGSISLKILPASGQDIRGGLWRLWYQGCRVWNHPPELLDCLEPELQKRHASARRSSRRRIFRLSGVYL